VRRGPGRDSLSTVRASPLVSLIVAAVALAAPVAVAGPGFDPDAIYAVPLGDAPTRGPADAPITIVEFSDFACGYCNRMQPVLRQVERLHPGLIRWVYRPLPLDEDDGTLASEAAIAAGLQGRFWPMHDRLFAVRGRVDRAAVELLAVELGLDLVRFRDDLDRGAARAAVDANLAAARALGVGGTPAFFVNGRALPGAVPLTALVDVIAAELARAREVPAGPDRYAALIGDGRPRADVDEPRYPQRELTSEERYRVGLGLPGHRRGPDDAAVTIVVWSDFLCPYCVRQAPVLEALRAAHPTRVRVVYRHYPLAIHPGADVAAEAAVEAGRQGKFWAFHDELMAAAAGGLPRSVLLERAARVGLDLGALTAALADHRHRDVVLADAAAAAALGAGGTPTVIVNGLALPGMVEADELEAVVAAELARADELVARGVAPADVYAIIGLGADRTEQGDPRGLARGAGLRIEPGAIERTKMIEGACRAGDRADAAALVGRLRGAEAAAARAYCADRGIDLP
jgi:protein-disulfide isomerase